MDLKLQRMIDLIDKCSVQKLLFCISYFWVLPFVNFHISFLSWTFLLNYIVHKATHPTRGVLVYGNNSYFDKTTLVWLDKPIKIKKGITFFFSSDLLKPFICLLLENVRKSQVFRINTPVWLWLLIFHSYDNSDIKTW
jgi:hypothetical protein